MLGVYILMVNAYTDHVSKQTHFRREFHQFKLSHSTLPSPSPLSTMSMHPHHNCTAVRPSFSGHSTHFVSFTHTPHPLVHPPSSPMLTPPCHHNSPSPGVAFTLYTTLAAFLTASPTSHLSRLILQERSSPRVFPTVKRVFSPPPKRGPHLPQSFLS